MRYALDVREVYIGRYVCVAVVPVECVIHDRRVHRLWSVLALAGPGARFFWPEVRSREFTDYTVLIN